jgi:methionyl-tRNA formyltransferase
MSIVFFGTTDTGWHCLDQMLRAGLPVTGIVTGTPELEIPNARGKVKNLRYRAFENFQRDAGVPILHFSRAYDDRFMQTLSAWSPSLLVVIGWHHLIPAKVRELAPLGAVGVHWSLLPKYRGGSPLVWAIINGEIETGASLFYLDSQIDAGPVIAQEKASIGEHEDVAQMIDKLNLVSGQLVVEYLPKVLNGTATAQAQDEAAATFFPIRSPGDGRIDWRWPARRIYNFIRAQTLPYPCAFSEYQGHTIKIVKATLQPVKGIHVCVRAGDEVWLGLEKIKIDDETEVRNALGYFQREEIEF